MKKSKMILTIIGVIALSVIMSISSIFIYYI